MTCNRSADLNLDGTTASITTTPFDCKPGEMASSLVTVLISSPAPAARSTANPTCATTSPLSSRPPRAPTPPVLVVESPGESARPPQSTTVGTMATSAEAATPAPSDAHSTVQSSTATSATAPSDSDRTSS